MRIKRLSEDVINKIAAGEILHKPVNAVKELIENSLDAGSTTISVMVSDGGLKLIQIQDNGCGMHKDDLAIVCNRFTTSKLATVEDLCQGLSTFGFRGEALASISYVSNVTIISKTIDSPCAYKVQYRDGDPLYEPKPCAGNTGTTIIIEDMFYNMPTRRKLLSNTNEEYQRIVECIMRYAIDRFDVSFSCRRLGVNIQDVSTQVGSDSLETVRQLFPSALCKELRDLTISLDSSFSASIIYSNANFNQKRYFFVLFINGRLVECSGLRSAIANVFAKYLPKSTYPWIYVSIKIPLHKVDVNVHPTKKEVQFLEEDILIETIVLKLHDAIAASQSSRSFVASTLPHAQKVTALNKVPECEKVRNDHKLQKVDDVLRSGGLVVTRRNTTEERNMELTSIMELNTAIDTNYEPDVSKLFNEHVYVGVADENRVILQYRSALFMVDLKVRY